MFSYNSQNLCDCGMKVFFLYVALAQLQPTSVSAGSYLADRLVERHDHNLERRGSSQSNCTQDSPEYFRRRAALQCQESYIRAVEAEFARSNCNNTFYAEIYGGVDLHEDEPSPPCEGPRDDRKSVPECSKICAARQFNYFYCVYLGEQYAALREDCMDPLSGSEYCGYYDGGFCAEKENLMIPVRQECLVSSDGSVQVNCSESCRAAVSTFRNGTGCCAPFLLVIEHANGEPRTADIFSICQEEVPPVCTGYSLPEELLNCARDPSTTDPPDATTIETTSGGCDTSEALLRLAVTIVLLSAIVQLTDLHY